MKSGEWKAGTRWIQKPGLPKNSVTLCAVSQSAAACQVRQALSQRGIMVLPVPESATLPAPCASHPDMLLCHLGGETVVAGSVPLKELLETMNARVILPNRLPGCVYPWDAALNCLVLGGLLFGRLDSIDESILSAAAGRKMDMISVAQGYTRCSVCVVDERSIITADPSIDRAAREKGIAVLPVSPGNICLPGYDYGFIGGCSGLLGPDKLAFCGSLTSHPDGKRIRAFVEERDIAVFELPSPDGRLWDIGGILPLMEATEEQDHFLFGS